MKKFSKNRITIIIPVYNEEKYINTVINRVKKNVNFRKQIIVVDDNSSDQSKNIIKKIKNIDKRFFIKKI